MLPALIAAVGVAKVAGPLLQKLGARMQAYAKAHAAHEKSPSKATKAVAQKALKKVGAAKKAAAKAGVPKESIKDALKSAIAKFFGKAPAKAPAAKPAEHAEHAHAPAEHTAAGGGKKPSPVAAYMKGPRGGTYTIGPGGKKVYAKRA